MLPTPPGASRLSTAQERTRGPGRPARTARPGSARSPGPQRAGYGIEEHRVAGHVLLAVTGGRRPRVGRVPGPDWRGPPGLPDIPRCNITVGLTGPPGPC